MKISKYNYLFSVSDRNYIYNTFSTAIAELDLETFNCINSNKIQNIKSDYIEALKSNGFIVDNDLDEFESYMYFYDTVRLGASSETLTVTFIPTYACNLECPYCSQGQNKASKKISIENTLAIIKFIENEIVCSKKPGAVEIKRLRLSIFGGEPMLAKEIVALFVEKTSELAKKLDIPVIYSMTSNFTLLDDDTIRMIKEKNISVQVSIDGTKLQHDCRRITKDGKGTYDTILSNLNKMKKAGLQELVVIRINIDKNNINNAEEILNAVKTFSPDCYYGFIDLFEGNNDCFAENCIDQNNYSEENTRRLDSILKKNGFPVIPRFGKRSPCAMHCMNKYFVDLNLDVYKCELLLKNKSYRTGTISTDGKFIKNAQYYQQLNHSPRKYGQCTGCKLFPMCAGGCTGKGILAGNHKCLFTDADLLSYLKNYVSEIFSEETK